MMNKNDDGYKPWRSRKLWFFMTSLAVGTAAAFAGHLSAELVTLLCALPSVYGVVNVRAKKVAGFEVE